LIERFNVRRVFRDVLRDLLGCTPSASMFDTSRRDLHCLAYVRLVTFGGLALESEDGSLAPSVRPQRLSILAVLAAADRGVSRERMCSLFWPEADEEHARAALRQALYALRQELDADVVRADPLLTLDRSAVSSDVGEFRTALAAGERERAARLAKGPFLDGFFLSGAPGFERWVEEERATLADEAARAMLALAREADARQDLDAATGLVAPAHGAPSGQRSLRVGLRACARRARRSRRCAAIH
jgi:DNA-binding SARP family transcriptional activator